MKAAVLFKDGFEELEALSVVDVLRRANMTCQMIGMVALSVTSSHGIEIKVVKCLMKVFMKLIWLCCQEDYRERLHFVMMKELLIF